MALLQVPTNQEDREVYLREHNAGSFVDAVETTLKTADTVIMTIKAFAGEPGVLYVALEYAYECGMTVTLVPGPSQRT